MRTSLLRAALPAAFTFLVAPAVLAGPIFDGKTLNGWSGETTKVWRVEDGAIVGGSLEGNPRNEFLTWKAPLRDFVLKLEYKLIGTEGFVNGGVQIRSKRIENPPNEMFGYQADIGMGFSGSLYDESRRKKVLAQADKELIAKLEKPGDWNRYEIRCEGARIQLFLNGTKTVDFTETEPGIDREGLIALQIHGNAKSEIRYRNITLDDLAPAAGAQAGEPLQRFATPQAKTSREPFAGGQFKLEPGEVIVLAGETNFVREQKSGALESRLAARFAGEQPRFRSMAWEADTVYEQWRELNFGSWKDQLSAAGASIVLAQFGQMESLDGAAKLPEFTAAYARLLDEMSTQTRKLVLVSPMPFEKPASPHVPDLTTRNDVVKAYADAIRDLAKHRGAVFVDLFTPLASREANAPKLTDNGIHLNERGLDVVAGIVAKQLGVEDSSAPPSAALREAIVQKNTFWAECWRPDNWAFAYGDRTQQLFGKPAGNGLSLAQEYTAMRPLVEKADARIHALARGADAPPITLAPPQEKSEAEALTPEQELATFTLAEGWECKLFASEADGVVKPTQMSWDERGRLLVACSPTYPHLAPGVAAGDYILALEDTNGDGRADKSWRFADKLKMVQGVEPGAGGVYVCDYSELVHFRDRDGDGVADERRVVYSGFGTGDTHQLINSITHGPDGALWFTQGLHNFARIETPWGNTRLHKAGVWRLDPRTLRLDAFFNGAKAGANCWGVAFDDYGQVFHKSGDRPAGYYSVPGLIRLENPDEYHPTGALFDTNPKTTALDFIGTRALPEEVQGCAVLGGFMGNVVELHRTIDDGSGFKSEQLPKLLRSTWNGFRPVDVSVGPDGAIYVADWFNPVIGHYQASYRDPLRDKSHGRIWRISAKGRAPVKQPNLAAMKPAELLEQLRSPERWTRTQAKRLLFDGEPAQVLREADAFVAKLGSDAESERLLLEVSGVFAAHLSPRPALVERLVKATDARVRAYGARVVGQWAASLPNALDLLGALIRDENPRVRLETIVACSYVNDPRAIEVAALALAKPTDRFINYALAQCVRATKPVWKPKLDTLTFGGDAQAKARIVSLSGAEPPAPTPGKTVYDSLCMNCHQPDAKGLPGIYPPLRESEWVNGATEPLIKMLLHGLIGKITVGGQEFGVAAQIPMPPSSLTDEQIAQVLTYVRSSFGNKSGAVAVEEVSKVRAAHANRTTPWDAAELTR